MYGGYWSARRESEDSNQFRQSRRRSRPNGRAATPKRPERFGTPEAPRSGSAQDVRYQSRSQTWQTPKKGTLQKGPFFVISREKRGSELLRQSPEKNKPSVTQGAAIPIDSDQIAAGLHVTHCFHIVQTVRAIRFGISICNGLSFATTKLEVVDQEIAKRRADPKYRFETS